VIGNRRSKVFANQGRVIINHRPSRYSLLEPVKLSWSILAILGMMIFPNQVIFAEQDVFEKQSALPIYRAPPVYPRTELKRLNSGIVDLTFMIDENGRTFEPMVTWSSRWQFERAAIKAVLAYIYEPAMLNGEAISSRNQIRILFDVEGNDSSMSGLFYRQFKLLNDALESDSADKKNISKRIARLKKIRQKTLMSSALVAALDYRYSLLFASVERQNLALQEIENYSGERNAVKVLGKKYSQNIFDKTIELWLADQDYGSILRKYKVAQNGGSEEFINRFSTAYEKIIFHLDDERFLTLKRTIGRRGYTSVELFQNHFSIYSELGEIQNFKLRCERGFLSLTYIKGKRYEVPKHLGQCNLQVVGDNDTKLELMQFSSNIPTEQKE